MKIAKAVKQNTSMEKLNVYQPGTVIKREHVL